MDSNLNTYQLMTDEELIRHYKAKEDRAAIGVLYKRYAHLVLGLSLKYLKNRENAEDAVMDIFEKLSFLLKEHEIQNFKGWLYQVSRNHCLKALKKRSKDLFYEINPGNEPIFMESGAENAHNKEDNILALNQALDELKEHQRKCVVLFYLKQQTYKEVSDVTGFSIKEVKSYIQNGKRNLQLKLAQ